MCSAGYQTLLEQSPDHQILFYMQRLQVLQVSCAFVIYSMLTNLHIRQCKTMYGMVKWNDHGIRCNVGHLLCGFYWGVLLPRLTFESIFLSQVCIFWQKILSQWYIFLLNSLWKGTFLTKISKNGVWGVNYRSFSEKFSYQGNIWAKIP